MTGMYPRIAERLFGHAHAIEPGAFRTMLDGPAAKRILSGDRPEAKSSGKRRKASSSRLSALVDAEPVQVAGGVAEYGLTDDGVAIIPVCGVLSRRFDWLTDLCGWTTYEGLSAAFDQMLADSRVKAILLDVESPGGEAAGMLDICDKIIAARSIKTIWACANTYAASAAYGIAGSASRLVLPRLGQVGSIGCVMVHVDQSVADQTAGLGYTAIYSGARKIDGWGHAPLSDGATKVYQADTDSVRRQFADLVGRQGRMTAEQAMRTEAGIASDFDAVSEHYADAIQTFDDVLAELSDLAAGRPRSTPAAVSAVSNGGRSPMNTPKTEGNEPEKTEIVTDPPAAPAAPETPEAPAAAAAPAAAVTPPEYSAEMMTETMELCAIAGAPLKDAQAFVTAKTPPAKVRADLAARKAAAADEILLNATAAKPAANAGWDDVVDKVNTQFGFAPKK